jgi:TonB-linked SusC/RagA family outer membrane protein
MKKSLKWGSFFSKKTQISLIPRILSLIALFLCTSFTANASINARAEKTITVNFKNVPLSNVITQIEKQTDYLFVYGETAVDMKRIVSINVKNSKVEDVLKTVFGGTSIVFEIEGKNIVLKKESGTLKSLTGQAGRKVTGFITDEAGEAIIGASVMVKGSKAGTVTDINGKFSLDVSDQSTLTVSYIGYISTDVKVGAQKTLSLNLKQDSKNLDEVVVVGYGTQRKENLTGAVGTITASKLANRPVTSVQNALQGLTPGLTVLNRPGDVGNDIASITVRGRTNLQAPGPLVIIDGVPVSSREFATLSANDIESMSVLKDASSASIYGSRAANGVILVTTKKGATGRMSVELSSSYGVQSPTRLSEYLGSADYARLYNEAMVNAGKKPKFSDDVIKKFQSGENPDLYPNTNWYDEALAKNPIYKDIQVAINGSTKLSRVYLSLGAMNQESLVKAKDLTRYSLRLNTETQVLPILKIGTNTSYIKQDMNRNGDMNWVALNRLVPTMVSRHSDGSWGTINAGTADATLAKENVLRNVSEGSKAWDKDYVIQTSVNAKFNPFKGLTINALGSLKYDNRMGWTFTNELPALVNFITKQPIASTAVTPNEMKETWRRRQEAMLQVYAEYERTIDKHAFKIMSGASQESNIYRSIFAGRKRFQNNELGTVSAGSSLAEDMTTNFKDYENVDVPGNTSINVEWAMRSFFGRMNYAYAGKYLLEGNLRIDESSRFHPDYRKATFPSVSAGWRVSEESFMKDLRWLNNMKIRTSWGVLGNQDNVAPGNYFALLNTGYAYNFEGSPVDGIWQSQGTNIQASWEKVYMKNIGLDLSLWNGMLDFSADYFIKTTNDILLNGRAPKTYGLDVPTVNVGSTENKGIEISINHNNSIGKDFKYNVSLNLASYKNKILNLGNDQERISSYWIEKVGESVGSFYGYQADGLFADAADVKSHAFQTASTKPGDIKYRDQNGDNKIDANDRVVIGNDVPLLNYGFSLGASYKQFDFSIQTYGVANVKVYLDNEVSQSFFNGAGVKSYHLNRWTTENPNPNAAYPRLLITADGKQNYSNNSSFWLYDASFLRIRSLSLGYSLTKSMTDMLGMQSARFYVSSNNPFTFMFDKRLTDYDPEMGSGRGGYPGVKTWVVGLNVKF